MSKSRSHFVEILQKIFLDDSVKKNCLLAVKNGLDCHNEGRIFDKFPLFLAQSEFDEITKEFGKIFSNIKNIDRKNEKLSLTNVDDRESIVKWEKKIAKIGCR